MRRWLVVLAGAIALLVSQAGPAVASTSGAETWVIVTHGGHPTRVMITGVVNDRGTAEDNIVVNPMTGTFTNHVVQTFPDGTLIFDDAGPTTYTMDPGTCHAIATFNAPFTITGGTGAFAGATGSGTVTGTLTFLFHPTPTGCSAAPVQILGTGGAQGTLTIP